MEPKGKFSLHMMEDTSNFLKGSKLCLMVGNRTYEFDCGDATYAQAWYDAIQIHISKDAIAL